MSLVTAARDSLGEDCIQIFNGQRAYGEPAFAALADGAFYELFPTLFFPDNDMAHARTLRTPTACSTSGTGSGAIMAARTSSSRVSGIRGTSTTTA